MERKDTICVFVRVCVKVTSPKKKFSAFLLLTVPPLGMFGSGQRSKAVEVEKKVRVTTKEAASRR